jgi:MscS family membrane protein
MNDFLHYVILNNTLLAYIWVLLSFVTGFALKRFVSKYLATLLYNIFRRKGKVFKKKLFLDLIVTPLEWFLMLVVVMVAAEKLNYPDILVFEVYRVSFRSIIDSLAKGALVCMFIWLCIRVVEFLSIVLAEKANETQDAQDSQLVVFFKDFFKVLLLLLGVILLLKFSFNYKITNLLTGLSIVGAALALATRESLENLIASFIIFFDKPFTTGDTVKVQGFTGNVEKIGLRSTRIRTADKTYISVPNKQMVDTVLDNQSLRTQRKVAFTLELSLSASSGQVKNVVEAVKGICNQEHVDKSNIFFSETGRNAHVISVEYFTSMRQTQEQHNELREAINLAILDLLSGAQIELAAASTDIVVQQK